MGKKGQIGESFQDISATIFIVILMIIFIALSTATFWNPKRILNEKILPQQEFNDLHFSLMSALKTETSMAEQQKITLADLARLTATKPGLKSMFENEMKKVLPQYRIELSLIEGKTKVTLDDEINKSEISFYLPIENKNQNNQVVKIKISKNKVK